ncbi:hypothetical protein DZB86_27180 [Bacillus sp. RC]|nr:hypothetical protein DZB86_27180 [Bacillus sp. RC]
MSVILCMAVLLCIYGWITKRKIMSIVAALLAVGVFVYDPATAKEIGELASHVGGPIAPLE